MNILEHINAGHYPVDDKGRAQVPMRDGLTATIAATDKPGTHPIVGWYDDDNPECWQASGQFLTGLGDAMDLLPPPPRKVRRFIAVFDSVGYPSPDDLHKAVVDLHGTRPYAVATVEYEEPWA